MLTMKEDAIIKSARGEIPFEEVNTLGGQFDLDDAVPEAPAPAPIALTEEGDGSAADDKPLAADKPELKI